MTSAREVHLTADELDDHLIGDLAAEQAAHLAGCSLCTARVAEAAAPMASFNAVSLAWGERHSAAAPIPAVAAVAAAQSAWNRRLGWSLAMTTCVVLTFAGIGHRSQVADDSAAFAQASSQSGFERAPSPDQLSNDNQLLNTIDRELNAPHESTAALGLLTVSAARPANARPAFVQAALQN